LGKIKEFIAGGGKPDQLENVDKFFLELSSIPQLNDRLICMLYKTNFPVKLNELKPSLLRVKKANSQLKESNANFHKLLEVRDTKLSPP